MPRSAADVRCALLPGLDEAAQQGGTDHGRRFWIGRSVAILFAREGADVAIVHLDEADDAETTRKAVEAEGARRLVLAGDVTDRRFCKLAVRRTVEALGGLNVLVNNAAFQLHALRIEDLSEAHFDRTLKTNLYGYFHMAQAAIPHMKPGDAIVNNGSVTGLQGSKYLLDYSMTKGGIHAFTKSLAAQPLRAASASTQRRRARSGRRSIRPTNRRATSPGSARRHR